MNPNQGNSLNTSLSNQVAGPNKQSVHSQQNLEQEQHKSQEKVLITGDDILIEYVDRLMMTLKGVNEEVLQENWKVALDKFITHYVWH